MKMLCLLEAIKVEAKALENTASAVYHFCGNNWLYSFYGQNKI
jgi:hypothetical protein